MALAPERVGVPDATSEAPSAADAGRDKGLGPLAPARRMKLVLVVLDAIALGLAMPASLLLADRLGDPLGAGEPLSHALLAAASLPLYLGWFARVRLYQARFVSRRPHEWRRLVRGMLGGTAGLALLGLAVSRYLQRDFLLLVLVLGLVLLASEREVVRQYFRRQRRCGAVSRRAIVAGWNPEGRRLAALLAEDPSLGYEVVGFVGRAVEAHPDVVGTPDELLEVVADLCADSVLVTGTAIGDEVTRPMVRNLLRAGVHVELPAPLLDVVPERFTLHTVGRAPQALTMLYVEPLHQQGWRSVAKRGFDLVIGMGTLLAVSPVLLLSALAIRLDSRGPILFRQVRVGRDGEPFTVFKLRTMVVGAEHMRDSLAHLNESDGPLFKMQDDPRVSRVGRVLRAWSIDELPQLMNVVRGEMSLVGPRPALPEEVEAWPLPLRERLRVHPGMTGMWQVNGRSNASFDEYQRLDLYYVDNWSLATDVAILLQTVPAVISRRGAR